MKFRQKVISTKNDFFCIIQPSDKSFLEEEICYKFSVKPIVVPENGMMAWGIKKVFETACHENVLFLESDFRCLEPTDVVLECLTQSLKFLETRDADIVRLRSLKNPGHPIQALNLKGNELKNSDHIRQLYLCTHYLENPHKTFPEHIQLILDSPRVYKMSSSNCVYTNNPTITTKRFFYSEIFPYIKFGCHLEPEIDVDWATKNHKIFITNGLFTHVRLDGHEGKNCSCCPVKYGGISDISLYCVCCKGTIYDPPFFKK